MVEDISNLLNTGEVPNLFDSGEQAGIGENIRWAPCYCLFNILVILWGAPRHSVK